LSSNGAQRLAKPKVHYAPKKEFFDKVWKLSNVLVVLYEVNRELVVLNPKEQRK
jgi:hypothetical protein